MLTAHSLDPKSLKRSIEMGACAYLPRKTGRDRSFLEDIFGILRWFICLGRLMNALEGYFAGRWGELWKKSEEKFWKDFEKRPPVLKNENKWGWVLELDKRVY